MERFARVAFVNNESGAQIEGEFIADTGPTWMMKPSGKPVQVLQKTEWTSKPTTPGYGDVFDTFFFGGL